MYRENGLVPGRFPACMIWEAEARLAARAGAGLPSLLFDRVSDGCRAAAAVPPGHLRQGGRQVRAGRAAQVEPLHDGLAWATGQGPGCR